MHVAGPEANDTLLLASHMHVSQKIRKRSSGGCFQKAECGGAFGIYGSHVMAIDGMPYVKVPVSSLFIW